jgi:tetratricopeptide (TPR) repeat protein
LYAVSATGNFGDERALSGPAASRYFRTATPEVTRSGMSTMGFSPRTPIMITASLFLVLANVGQSAGQVAGEQLDRGGCVRGPATESAMQECHTLIAKDPNDPDLLINRGNGWLRKKEFLKAEADFQQAVRIRPGYFRAHAALGTLRERQGDNDAAEAPLVKRSNSTQTTQIPTPIAV